MDANRSGKLLGERISREWVLPIFILGVLYVATLVTYPHETLAGTSMFYLAMIPVGWRRFQKNLARDAEEASKDANASVASGASGAKADTASDVAPRDNKTEGGRIVELRSPDNRT